MGCTEGSIYWPRFKFELKDHLEKMLFLWSYASALILELKKGKDKWKMDQKYAKEKSGSQGLLV